MKSCKIVFAFIFFISSLSVYSQTKKTYKLNPDDVITKDYVFNSENLNQEIIIKVKGDYDHVNIHFKGSLISGRMTATIYDPNKKREGGFILQGAEPTKKNEITANGDLICRLDKPINGSWMIKLIVAKARGRLEIIINEKDK